MFFTFMCNTSISKPKVEVATLLSQEERHTVWGLRLKE